MKIILSRKGVDSDAGQCASAIVDGRPISLPIPATKPTSSKYYRDLAPLISALANDLSRGGLGPSRAVHLDPDIDPNALDTRPPGWRGAFGQANEALSHLRNQRVGPGDLFLFWGRFRECAQHEGEWRYVGSLKHSIFGWLEVESFEELRPDGTHVLDKYPWLRDHPHVHGDWPPNNGLFIARELLSIGDGTIPGFGVFKTPIVLTKAGSKTPSIWSVPNWLNKAVGGTGMTFHDTSDRWHIDGTVQIVGRGQEFVAHAGNRPDAREWLLSQFASHN